MKKRNSLARSHLPDGALANDSVSIESLQSSVGAPDEGNLAETELLNACDNSFSLEEVLEN